MPFQFVKSNIRNFGSIQTIFNMASIFTKIVAGDIPSYKIAESDQFYAFLDINPLARGHALVIPKQEIDYIFDLDESTYTNLFAFAKKVGLAIEKVIACKRIGIIVFGLDVPHAHIHLIPRRDRDVEDPRGGVRGAIPGKIGY